MNPSSRAECDTATAPTSATPPSQRRCTDAVCRGHPACPRHTCNGHPIHDPREDELDPQARARFWRAYLAAISLLILLLVFWLRV
jgi:hypothetical protein